jgi:hypothetical protein
MIKAHEKDAVRSKAKPKDAQSLRRAITELAAQENAKVPAERRVTQRDIEVVAARSLNKTVGLERASRFFAAYKEVASFVTLATTGKNQFEITQNRDLLAIGHPLSTRSHAMTASAYSHTVARWIAADPRIDDSVRELVATAYMAPIDSVEHQHANARLALLASGLVPRELLIPSGLVTTLSPIIAVGGNDSASRSARARLQRRDRKGQFAEQGGGMQFFLRGLGGKITSVVGKFVANSDKTEGFQIEVKNDKVLKDGIYDVPASQVEAIKAIIPDESAPDEVTLPSDVEAVDLNEISGVDVPAGWSLVSTKKDGETGPDKVFKSSDGYLVDYYEPDNEGKKAAAQKAWTFNTPIGSKFGNPPAVKNAAGETGMKSKLDSNEPMFILWRDTTDVTSKKSVAMTQNWSDTQEYAEVDEKAFDADYAKGLEQKAKQDEANEKSKASQEAFIKKAEEIAAQAAARTAGNKNLSPKPAIGGQAVGARPSSKPGPRKSAPDIDQRLADLYEYATQ